MLPMLVCVIAYHYFDSIFLFSPIKMANNKINSFRNIDNEDVQRYQKQIGTIRMELVSELYWLRKLEKTLDCKELSQCLFRLESICKLVLQCDKAGFRDYCSWAQSLMEEFASIGPSSYDEEFSDED